MNPPATVIDGATPAISNGWTKQDSISFLFHGEYDDADTGAIRYDCTFTGPSQDVTTDDCAPTRPVLTAESQRPGSS